MAEGSDISVSHGGPATTSVGTQVDLYLRVRDLSGRPLEGAKVFVDRPKDPTVTDKAGLCVIKGKSGGSFTVSAEYEANFGKFGVRKGVFKEQRLAIAPFDPTPPGAPADPNVHLEVHATIRIPVEYRLLKLFGWQNPALRPKIYMDPVPVAGHRRLDETNKDKSREWQLREGLRVYDAGGRKEIAEAKKAVEARKKLIDERNKALGIDDKRIKDDQAALDAHDARVAKLSDDERSAKEKVNADKRAALQKKLDDDTAKRAADKEKLDEASNVEAVDRALEVALASHGGSTHRQVMEYIVKQALPKSRYANEPWIKYAIIHLTGLRYRPSHNCCFPPEDIVYGMRELEIDTREHPSSRGASSKEEHAERQRIFAREYLSLLSSDEDLAKRVASFFDKQIGGVYAGTTMRKYAGRSGKPFKPGQIIDLLKKIALSDGPFSVDPPDAQSKSKAPAKGPSLLYDLRAVASAVCQAWIQGVGAEGKRSGGAPPDEGEFLGEIADRYFNGGQIPENVWIRAMSSTPLLNDFADAKTATSDADWNIKKVGAWNRVFPTDGSLWLKHHQRTFQPYFTSVVCNDVTSILARLRGLPIGDQEFMMGMANELFRYGKASKTKSPSDPSFVGLFRPQKLTDLRRGDILFWGKWIKDGERSDDYIIPPAYVLDLGPCSAKVDPTQLARAIKQGVQSADGTSILQLPPDKKTFAFAVERNRRVTVSDAEGNERTFRYADRLVRAWPDKDGSAVNDWLSYMHVAMIIDIDEANGNAILYETAAPVGIVVRPWEYNDHPQWCLNIPEVFAGRSPPGEAPNLDWFLDEHNLLDEGRLDDG